MNFVITRHFVLLLIALVVQAIIFLALLVPFALPNLPAWQAFAFGAFFASFI